MRFLFIALKKIILVAGDLTAWFLALSFALLARFKGGFNKDLWLKNFEYFFYLFFLWLMVFFIFDLYNIRKMQDKIKYFSAYFQAFILALILSIVAFYSSVFSFGFAPKTILLFHVFFFSCLFILWRLLYLKLLKKSKFQKNIAVLGHSKELQEIINELSLSKDLNICLIFNLNDSFECENYCFKNKIKNYHSKSHDNLLKIFQENNIDEVIIASDKINDLFKKNLFESLKLGIDIFSLNDFYENFFRRIHLNEIDQTWFINKIQEGSKKLFEYAKRALDIFLSLVLLILLIVTFPLIYLLIKIDSPGPVFFIQTRTGRFGRNFQLIKYRSMRNDSESGQPQWARANDFRVTRVGKILRKTRIDELPQCINILRGEMSFVGPRPERPEFIAELEKAIPFYKQRLLVKPGLTGWAQINYPYASSVEDSWKKMQYDLFYVKNRSMILDVVIILRTVEVILLTKGQ